MLHYDYDPEDWYVESAVIQSQARLSSEELFYQFIVDATEIISEARGEPWWDLMELTDAALDISDRDLRLDTLEYYVTLAERGLLIEDYHYNWDDGYVIYREV